MKRYKLQYDKFQHHPLQDVRHHQTLRFPERGQNGRFQKMSKTRFEGHTLTDLLSKDNDYYKRKYKLKMGTYRKVSPLSPNPI